MDKNKKEANTKPVVVKGGRSLTGQPLNPIDINPQLNKKQVNEQSRGGVVLTFGRMNPPTVGHEKLVNKLISVASKEKATPMVFLSHSQDKKKNPLEHKDKVRFAKMAFGNVVQNSPARTLIDILKSLEGKFKTATVVVGDDRVKEFTELLNKYNGKDYNFDSINVVSAGQRDPDAEGVEGMSASKMRQAIVDKDALRFKSGLPSRLKASAREVYDLLRHGMRLQEELEQEELLGEALSIDQRRKRGLVMRKYQAKISRARELASKRLAPTDRLKKRARNKAIELVRRRVAGRRGMDYAKLSPSEKMQVDKAVEKRKKAIGKIAQRIYPSVKTAEFERLKSYMHGHALDHLHTNAKVNEELNALFEQHHTAVKPQTLSDIINEMVSVATARVITEKEVQALEKKAERYNVEYDLIEQVFMRGLLDTVGDHQAAFNRVNAFVNGGRTAKNEDLDLFEAAGLDEAFSKASEARKKIEKVDRKPPHTELGKQAEIQTKIIDEDLYEQIERKDLDEEFENYSFKMKPGDKTKVLRGDHKGKSGVVVSSHDGGSEYTIKHKDGSTMKHHISTLDKPMSEDINEDLRKWFDQKWVRMDTKGEIKGDCAREEGEGKPKCLPQAKAQAMDKDDRAKAARRKRREDPVADRQGKGGKPVNVATEAYIVEKNSPPNPALWSRAKALARSKFDVYPSAYANGWAAKYYKSKGGGWKSVSEEAIDEKCWDGYRQAGMKRKGSKVVPNCVPEDVAFENFLDGKGPGKPGDSARHGLKGKTSAELKSIRSSDTASPRKKQLAHFMLNMTRKESIEEGYDVNSKHYKALTDLDLNTKNRDMTTQNDGYGPLNPNDEKGSKPFWDAKAKMWKTTTEAAMEARCGNCAAFNQAPAVMKKMAEGLGPAGDKIQDLANLGFCELFEFKCAGDRTCNKWLVNGPITEEAKVETLDENFNIAYGAGVGVTLFASDLGIKAQGGFAYHPSVIQQMEEEEFVEEVRTADKGPVVVPAHRDARGSTIPAKTVMRKKNRVIVNRGDNPSDGQ